MRGILLISDCLRGDFFTEKFFPKTFKKAEEYTTNWNSVYGYTGPAMIELLCAGKGEQVKSKIENPYGRFFNNKCEKMSFTKAFLKSYLVTNSACLNGLDGWNKVCDDSWIKIKWRNYRLKDLVDEGLKWLKRNDDLLIIFNVDTHSNVHPFINSKREDDEADYSFIKVLNSDDEEVLIPETYVNSLKKLDEQLNRLIKIGYPVILTSDHGDIVFKSKKGDLKMWHPLKGRSPEQFRVPVALFNTRFDLEAYDSHTDMGNVVFNSLL